VKFLVDAQLPFRLCELLAAAGHDCVHTTQLPDGNRSADVTLIQLAVAEGRVLVSKDADFYYAYLTRRESFRLLLVRTGNLRAAALIDLFGRHLEEILQALSSHSLVELHSEGPRACR
jgi:predicted nuclease of predicted toxin-antitoxin system